MRNNLTERQKEILRFACFTNSKISQRLFLVKMPVVTLFNTILNILCAASKSSLLIKRIYRNELNIDEVETE